MQQLAIELVTERSQRIAGGGVGPLGVGHGRDLTRVLRDRYPDEPTAKTYPRSARIDQRDLDGWALVERLLADLASLQERTMLVIDDVHELDSAEVLRQLELLVMRAPPELPRGA